MPDDILARYEHISHRELYTMLMRGSPNQVDELVATWKTMETTVSALAASLRADLDRLRAGWDSPAGREFDRRVGLIAEFAQTLAEEFCAIHTGLSVMSSALADAQSRAEHPDQPLPHPEPPVNLHGVGTLLHMIGTVVDGVIGSQLGHELNPAEKEKARNRMVQLISTLAAEYRVVDYGTWPPRVPPPPADTPQLRPNHVAAASAPVIPAQPAPEPAPEPVAAPVDPSVHKPHPGHPELPLPIPHEAPVLTAGDPNEHGTDFWGGTGPAIAAGVGLVAAGGVVAAAAIKSRHTKTSLGDDETTEATVEPDTDGVVRSHPVPVGAGDATTADIGAAGHDHTGHGGPSAAGGPGGPGGHFSGSELAGGSREGAVSVGSVGADGDTRGPGTPPPPPAAVGLGGPGTPGAAGAGSPGSYGGVGGSGGGYSGGGGGGGGSGYSYGSGGSSAGGAGGPGGASGGGPGASGTGTSGTATSLAAAGSSGPTPAGGATAGGSVGGPGGAGGMGGGGGAGADRWQSDGPSPWGTTDAPDPSTLNRSEASFVEDFDPDIDES